MTEPSLHARLRALIGQRFRYGGIVWVLHEILSEDDAVVLLRDDQHAGIQPLQGNLYGHGIRRSQESLTLPLSDPQDEGYSSELHDLLAGRILRPDG